MLKPSYEDDVRLDPRKLISYEGDLVCKTANGQRVLSIGDQRMVSVTAWWDPSFGAPDKGDASVVAAVFVDGIGSYWLHDIRYIVHDPNLCETIDEATQLCRQVVEFAQDLYLTSITIETNGLGKFLPALLRKEMHACGVSCSVIEHVSRGNKNQRILDAFDPILAAGALKVHANVWQTPFVDEMRDWRPDRNGRDDGLDATSACILSKPVRFQRSLQTRTKAWRQPQSPLSADVDFTL
jgi:hypothetical protein